MPKPIKDQFSDLKVSRQRKYQLRKYAAGQCVTCGKPAEVGQHCLKHAIAMRERQRVAQGCVKRNTCSKTYRLARLQEHISTL